MDYQRKDLYILANCMNNSKKSKGKGHPSTGTEVLYKPYGP